MTTVDDLCELVGNAGSDKHGARFAVVVVSALAGASIVQVRRIQRDERGEPRVVLDGVPFADGVGVSLTDACWWAGTEFGRRLRESGRGAA